ncbi:unnamed protein product [Eruca vesicaria subsp. sativa]|uniref:Yippee domain-containing protein n=1 Tax=Eruca vesicaria subsp. sativa TaxID=29727 RepID=A0ABC8JTY3_ERUVS|nr:unnamed protein product [Eruca vesicaria subsp. sativa]
MAPEEEQLLKLREDGKKARCAASSEATDLNDAGPSSVYIRPWHPMVSIRRLSWNVLRPEQISSSLMLFLVRSMEARESLLISTTGVATQIFCSSCLKYLSLRVSYVGERGETADAKSSKVFYSVLLKGGSKFDEDNYFEEAFNLKNVLEEFKKERDVGRKPTIGSRRTYIYGMYNFLARYQFLRYV